MTTPTTLDLDTPHQHTRSCFWDYLECRWQCPQAPAADEPTHAVTDTD